MAILNFRDRLKKALEIAVDKMIANNVSWDADLEKGTDVLEEAVAKEIAGTVSQFVIKIYEEIVSFENQILDELADKSKRKEVVNRIRENMVNRLVERSMSINSGAFSGKETYPTIVDMPMISKHPVPQAGWEGAETGMCPRCGNKVWLHDMIKVAMKQPNIVAICENCAQAERKKQSSL